MEKVYTKADMAAAWDSAYWHGTSHQGPLNSAVVNAKNPYLQDANMVPATTPAKACKVTLKTKKGRGESNANQNTTSSEPTNS
ncbi:hypothetical protein PV772_08790 [Pseudarthrobacter sp. CC12]|uniref:hypothetical protein n=1 Tax=Pseudarthrobacter sp. CC12 TaxID=3029193 RepID=UPI003266F550